MGRTAYSGAIRQWGATKTSTDLQRAVVANEQDGLSRPPNRAGTQSLKTAVIVSRGGPMLKPNMIRFCAGGGVHGRRAR